MSLYAWGWMGGGGVQLQGYTDYCSQSIRGERTDVEIHSFGKQDIVKELGSGYYQPSVNIA